MALFFIVVLQTALVVALFVLNFSLLSFAISWSLDVPFVATPTRYAKRIGEALEISSGDIVYDIGCGDGRVLIALARYYPEARYIGIERNPLLVQAARARAFVARTPHVSFRCEDAVRSDFGDATKIYVYLFSSFIGKVLPQIDASPSLTRLVSRAYTIPDRAPVETMAIDTPRACNKHLLHLYLFKR